MMLSLIEVDDLPAYQFGQVIGGPGDHPHCSLEAFTVAGSAIVDDIIIHSMFTNPNDMPRREICG